MPKKFYEIDPWAFSHNTLDITYEWTQHGKVFLPNNPFLPSMM